MKRFALVAALLALAAPRAVFAQVDRATVSGLVKDSGGAVVAGGMVFVSSGYGVFGADLPGNVLLAFSTKR